jgi:acyl-CoA thioesterase FadM
MTAPHTQDYAVRFGEIDHAGVMYYPAIFDRIHRSFEDFWLAATGRTYAQILDGDGIGFPLIDVQSTFRRPFRFGDVMRVQTSVLRIGGKSLTFRVELRGADDGDGEARATARLVTGVIAMGRFEATPLPDRYRAWLAPYLVSEPDPG